MITHKGERVERWIARGRQRLIDNPGEPSLALIEIMDIPEMEDAGLARLAHLLWTEKYGCHRNDVIGVFDLFEKWLEEQEVEEGARDSVPHDPQLHEPRRG